MDTHLKETRIDGSLAYDGSFLKVQRDTVRLPDGKPDTVPFTTAYGFTELNVARAPCLGT